MSTVRTRTRKDETQYHQVLFRDAGKQSSVAFDDRADAERWKKLLDQVGLAKAMEVAGILNDATPMLTVNEWITSYVDHLTGIEEGTRKRYRAYLRNDIAPALGELPLVTINHQAIASWILGLTNKSKTIANKHGFLYSAFASAVAAGHIESNPCHGQRLPAKEAGDEMVFLTGDEFALLQRCIPTVDQPLVLWLAATCMRWGEATALQIGDLDLTASTARVTRAWKETGGGPPRIGPPKTRKSRRTITVPPEALDAIRPLIKGRGRSDFVFTNHAGNPIRSSTFYKAVWVPAVALANGEDLRDSQKRTRAGTRWDGITPADTDNLLGKRPRIHDLRHTGASWMIQAGVPLPVVQEYLGHESITTTVDRYGHLDQRSRAAGAAAISSVLSASGRSPDR